MSAAIMSNRSNRKRVCTGKAARKHIGTGSEASKVEELPPRPKDEAVHQNEEPRGDCVVPQHFISEGVIGSLELAVICRCHYGHHHVLVQIRTTGRLDGNRLRNFRLLYVRPGTIWQRLANVAIVFVPEEDEGDESDAEDVRDPLFERVAAAPDLESVAELHRDLFPLCEWKSHPNGMCGRHEWINVVPQSAFI